MTTTAKNPILEGFYPDPSICAVGEDFYLVNSSFAYFPGVPIFHSKDLAHWEQIGNVLDREEQINLHQCGHSAGIFAPTIRYHKGTFYMITTNVSGGGNFIVTASNPAGPWSNPYFLGKAAEGIDPSLFFDDDGTCYYIGQRDNTEGITYDGDKEIWVQELDLDTMQLVGESKRVWKSALYGAVWSEGPHLYKKDGWYYVLIAEGGTGPEHAISVARSRNVYGPYEGNKANPIFTHRHLGRDYGIRYVGHSDIVETTAGDWYIVMLASRPCEGHSNIGRETFLAKVEWEYDWPVINPGVGMLTEKVPVNLPPFVFPEPEDFFHFYSEKPDYRLLRLRNPKEEYYSTTERYGFLRLYHSKETLSQKSTPTFVGVRQCHYNYTASTMMEFAPLNESESAGLTIYQNDLYHIKFEVTKVNNQNILQLRFHKKGEDVELGSVVLSEMVDKLQKETIFLKVVNRGQTAWFYYSLNGNDYSLITGDVSVRELSTEVAGGFVGCTIGMYATSNGAESNNYADFAYLSYKNIIG